MDLEIGTGNGFFFAHYASKYPDRFYLGVVLLRADRHVEAAAEFEAVRRYLQATGSRLTFHRAYNTLLLAICQAKLGRGDARSLIETAAAETRNLAGEPWGTELILELLGQALAQFKTQVDFRRRSVGQGRRSQPTRLVD